MSYPDICEQTQRTLEGYITIKYLCFVHENIATKKGE